MSIVPPPLPPPPTPGPDGAQPLSERELRILAKLRADLEASDPGLGMQLSHMGKEGERQPHQRTVDRSVLTAAVLVICWLILPSSWMGVLAFLALTICLPLLLLFSSSRG